MIQDVSAKLNDDANINVDLTKCQMRLKTSKSSSEDKVARKVGERREDGSVIWAAGDDEESLRGMPVRSRYGSALYMSFKDTSSLAGIKRASRKAMAVLWLRDIADNEDTTIEVPLWFVPDEDYSRLKMNYSPPDGNLEDWDDDKEKVQRVGSVQVHVFFKPGIGDRHHETMNGGGSKRREAWEAYMREKDGGLRDSVGEFDQDRRDPGRKPENYKGGRSESSESSESSRTRSEASDHPPAYTPRDEDGGGVWAGGSRPDLNTMVSSTAVENEEVRTPEGQEGEHDPEHDGGSDGEGKKGFVQKLKDWKSNEQELHRDHRGLMQLKPVRTAEWVKDNVEEGAHAVKNRFAMKGRKPDVETEV